MNTTVLHNISITFDFLRYVVSHPDLLESLPGGEDDTEIVFIESDYPVELPTEMEGVVLVKVAHTFEATVAA